MENQSAISSYDNAERVKEPPRSSDAEQAVIGALLLDNQCWDEVSEVVQAEDFYYYNNRLLFSAIAELAERNEPFDRPTLLTRLRDKEELDKAGGDEYLRRIAMEVPSTVNAGIYAQIVREQSIKRRLISAAGEIANSAFFPEGRDARTILDNAESKIFAITESFDRGGNQGLMSTRQVLAETIDLIEKMAQIDGEVTGIPTGFTELDNMTSGLQRGDLIIIAGRPSMGKTAFSINIAQSVALLAELPVAIFSLEMPARQLMLRILSSLTKIPQNQLRRGQFNQNHNAFQYAVGSQLMNAKIFIDDSSNISLNEIRNRCRRLKREQGELGLILIDYMQLMELPTGGGSDLNRATQIGDLSRGLKLLAKELEVPIIALSQLNRSLESRTDKRPIMSDIRESGAIEQDADLIMFVYRDVVYNKQNANPRAAEVIIGKQRNGPIGTVPLIFEGEFSLFRDAAPSIDDDDY
ncbi:replicative DNA helicase [Suttonella indologenes]|uniref:Replicative DNA helicase n=1 Tax=Suttonella indologenes TaxID=13276 RepID=A0A380MUY8_9GAMM|nr:replicative DNA helicase [Suttonella indologenes]SUO96400.1 Replicative DNA helicase [Suttonella indologenes]